MGCCGTEEKMEFAKSIGFDGVFNYKTEKSYTDALKRVAPQGIDCFFDNVSKVKLMFSQKLGKYSGFRSECATIRH